MQSACVSRYFVVLGVGTACLSTALGSMFGSARILQARHGYVASHALGVVLTRLAPQAIARDDIFPLFGPFKRGALKGDEPRRALVLTYVLAQAAALVLAAIQLSNSCCCAERVVVAAQAGLFYGGIDAIGPVLTNFFLITYALTNLSAAALELSGTPNFRPTWHAYCWQAHRHSSHDPATWHSAHDPATWRSSRSAARPSPSPPCFSSTRSSPHSLSPSPWQSIRTSRCDSTPPRGQVMGA